MVCGDFNADLASDVALCDLLSEQGLLLASLFLGRGGDMKECIKDCKDWVGRCCGELFFVPFFCLKGCFFFFLKSFLVKMMTDLLFRCIGQAPWCSGFAHQPEARTVEKR